jgi:transposase InsO family protein
VQSLIDGRKRLKYIYLLKKKSDAGGTLRDFIVKLEREHDYLVKAVHAENEAEFIGGDFKSCLREQGIKFTSSAPKSPESNGLAENFNKVLFARVRAFSIMPRWVRSCGARLLTTLCTYSTSHRHGRLVILLHMKLHMEMCLMSASFACLTAQYLRRFRIQRSSKTRLYALPAWDILVMENIVYYFRDPSARFSSRPPSSSMKKFLTMLLMPPRR